MLAGVNVTKQTMAGPPGKPLHK
uniref:Uncharacterized protein n=1 Tax=Arundo donax TaxID=35708 RepID=A0A0A8Z1S1_ARUDO